MDKFQIIDWDDHFENAGSRPVDICRWCPMPNKQDGLSYRRMVSNPDTIIYYAVWCALVLMCSKHRRHNREGWLTDNGEENGKALSPLDIFLKTGIPEEVIKDGLEFLSSDDISWIRNISKFGKIKKRPPLNIQQWKGRESVKQKKSAAAKERADRIRAELEDYASTLTAMLQADDDTTMFWGKIKDLYQENFPKAKSRIKQIASHQMDIAANG